MQLRDGERNLLEEGYFSYGFGGYLIYIKSIDKGWIGYKLRIGHLGLISINIKNSRFLFREYDQKQAAKNFEKETTSRKNNLERILKNFSKK